MAPHHTMNKEAVSPKAPVKGFLVDITGVLYNGKAGADGIAIENSAEAIAHIYEHSKVKFLSNTKGKRNVEVAARLERLGIKVRAEDIITPAPVVAAYCKENGLRPHLFVRNEVLPEFADIDTTTPNCVVVGEVEQGFTYERINEAFRILLNMPKPLLITMGTGKYFQRVDGPCIDVGAFGAALKFATDCEIINIGKPSPFYFEQGVAALGLKPDEIVMIGDDIASDVGGAQTCGIRGIQVKTGKFRKEFLDRGIVPDLVADDLYQAVMKISQNDFML